MEEKKNSFGGFTLVEVLVVMAIIAVLIGISVAGLGFAMRRSRNISRQSAMSNLDRALEAYYSDNLNYPVDTTVATLGALIDDSGVPADNILYEYLEGSWEAPPGTEVYYKSIDGILYTVCVNQEESGAGQSWVCTGPGIGDALYPDRESADDAVACELCFGICGVFENVNNTFSADCTGVVIPE